MSASGTASLNFGAYPGDTFATVDVSGQTGFVTTSEVEGWVLPVVTADHSIDEQILEELTVKAYYVSDGTFRIQGQATGQGSRSQNGHKVYGVFNIGWVWA